MALKALKLDMIQLIGFHVEQKLFGADISTVREILRYPTIEALEAPLQSISGIIRLRGQVIPTLDLRLRMGTATGSDAEGKKWVLVSEVEDLLVGFVADEVTRIYRIPSGSILPPPEIIHSDTARSYIQGVCESDDGMLVVLDVDKILSGDEIQALRQWTDNLDQI